MDTWNKKGITESRNPLNFQVPPAGIEPAWVSNLIPEIAHRWQEKCSRTPGRFWGLLRCQIWHLLEVNIVAVGKESVLGVRNR